MAEFEVTMAVDKAGGYPAVQDFYIIPSLIGGNQIQNSAGIIYQQNSAGF